MWKLEGAVNLQNPFSIQNVNHFQKRKNMLPICFIRRHFLFGPLRFSGFPVLSRRVLYSYLQGIQMFHIILLSPIETFCPPSSGILLEMFRFKTL